MNKIIPFWNEFLKTRSPSECSASYTAWAFGNTPEMNDNLGNLVLNGPKRATTSLKWVCEKFPNEKMPVVGDFSIILNSSGDPLCIIQTTSVEEKKFNEVDES